MKLIHLIVPLCVSASVVAGCSPGGALCAWLQKNNVAAQVTNGGGETVDLCTGQVSKTQAEGSDGAAAGASGFCDPSPRDTPCSECLKKACCADLTACGDDDTCLCRATRDAIQGCPGGSPTTPTYTAMASCYDAACPQCAGLQ